MVLWRSGAFLGRLVGQAPKWTCVPWPAQDNLTPVAWQFPDLLDEANRIPSIYPEPASQ